MKLCEFVRNLFQSVPEWELVAVCFALPLLWFAVCCPVRAGKIFRAFSEVYVPVGFAIFAAVYGLADGAIATALLVAECVLGYRLIPDRKAKIRAARKEEVPIGGAVPGDAAGDRPMRPSPVPPVPPAPPVSPVSPVPPASPVASETAMPFHPVMEIATHSIEETNLCLDHAFDVAARLKACPLTGSDRLETDNVELTLRMFRAKGILTDREMRSLNDSLALLLKLSAKYECTY
ncbi:MAG: hypothetical protein ACI4U2_01840 [Christensenellaceae bacterium]